MTIAEAISFIGGLSKPSKMPCFSYSIPPWECKTGGKLRSIKESVCAKCYAFKGRYGFPPVKNALKRRFESIGSALWVEAMTLAISGSEGSGFFRWHDAGDIQDLNHLEKIAQVARNLPSIQFWLPTREYKIVSEYVEKHGKFPANLTVRLSAYKVDGQAPLSLARRLGVLTSTVSSGSFTCPAPNQGNKCLACRACWNKDIETISYKKH